MKAAAVVVMAVAMLMSTGCAVLNDSAVRQNGIKTAYKLDAQRSVAENGKVLIITKTKSSEEFLGEALSLANSNNLTPITSQDLNGFIEAEKMKDLMGCSDVTCYSEISGAFNINYIITIQERNKIAVLRLYEQFPVPKMLRQDIVSHQDKMAAFKSKLQKEQKSLQSGGEDFSEIAASINCKTKPSEIEALFAGRYVETDRRYGMFRTIRIGDYWIHYNTEKDTLNYIETLHEKHKEYKQKILNCRF